jgi:hypothetical protein
MDQSGLKEKVVSICQELGGGLPYELGHLQGDSWQEIACELAELARLISSSGARIAAYASIAQRRANKGY